MNHWIGDSMIIKCENEECLHEFEQEKYWQGTCPECSTGFYWDRQSGQIVWADCRRKNERRTNEENLLKACIGIVRAFSNRNVVIPPFVLDAEIAVSKAGIYNFGINNDGSLTKQEEELNEWIEKYLKNRGE